MTNSAELRVGTVFVDRFEIVSVLAHGIRGTTYVARDGLSGGNVALMRGVSMLSDRQHHVLETTKQLLATLRHTGLASFVACGVVDQRLWFASTLVAGVSLEEALRTQGPIPMRRAATIASQIAKALAVPHAHGIFHRSLKPSNVLLVGGANGDSVAVLDLGIGAILCSDGRSIATPKFCAPEEFEGAAVDGRSDVYALGVILFQMLTGRAPFDGDGAQLMEAHRSKAPPQLRAMKPSAEPLEAAVNRALAKRPADRWASMAEFAASLDEVLAAPTVPLLVDASDPAETPAPPVANTWHLVAASESRTLAKEALAKAPQLETIALPDTAEAKAPSARERVTPASTARGPRSFRAREVWFVIALVVAATIAGVFVGLWLAAQ